MAERVFSGIQPTGSLHLGNYLGAIRNYVELQDRAEAIYCVVDEHALTSHPDPDELRRNVREAAKTTRAREYGTLSSDPAISTTFAVTPFAPAAGAIGTARGGGALSEHASPSAASAASSGAERRSTAR